jgi:hypothetical protein
MSWLSCEVLAQGNYSQAKEREQIKDLIRECLD